MNGRAPWSLRRRLLLGVTLLVAAIAVTTGAVTIASSHAQRVDRLDQQLLGAAERTRAASDRGPGIDSPRPPRPESRPPVTEFLPGQGAGALAVLIVDGDTFVAGYVGADGEGRELARDQLAALMALPASETVSTVDLGDELGRYRVVRTEIEGGEVIAFNGLSLQDVEATTTGLIVTTAVVGALGLLIAVLLGTVIVKVAIRPLDRIADTATRVSQLPLESRVAVPERVPAADTSPRTEVGRVGLALNELLSRVESALVARDAGEQRLRRFIADASHELRTPLAVIKGYADLADREVVELPAGARHPLERIGAESRRMTSLVEDLLLLARLDEGAEVRTTRTGIVQLVAEAVTGAHVAGPDHRWELDVPPDEIELLADPQRLHQVVANLLSNARVHTPPGTKVEVSLHATADTVVLTVADDGPGIPAEAIEGIFERFSRVDPSRARRTGGSGLGLAIAHAIVEAHHGTITVTSEPGCTRFIVTLPRG